MLRIWQPLHRAEQDGAARALRLGDVRAAPIAFFAVKRAPIADSVCVAVLCARTVAVDITAILAMRSMGDPPAWAASRPDAAPWFRAVSSTPASL